jgi:hypothetical protein
VRDGGGLGVVLLISGVRVVGLLLGDGVYGGSILLLVSYMPLAELTFLILSSGFVPVLGAETVT